MSSRPRPLQAGLVLRGLHRACRAMRWAAALPIALGAVLAAAGCAQLPPPTAHAPAADAPTDLARVLAQRRERAQRLEAGGDLLAARDHWQVVLLLAPHDRSAAAALAAVEARRTRALADALAAAGAARRRGDADGAARALLHALALEPTHPQAADELRRIEQQKMARIQAARVARQRSEPAPAMHDAERPATMPATAPPRPNALDD
jgi:tetratricopeptide (TPR) repeat protein